MRSEPGVGGSLCLCQTADDGVPYISFSFPWFDPACSHISPVRSCPIMKTMSFKSCSREGPSQFLRNGLVLTTTTTWKENRSKCPRSRVGWCREQRCLKSCWTSYSIMQHAAATSTSAQPGTPHLCRSSLRGLHSEVSFTPHPSSPPVSRGLFMTPTRSTAAWRR